MLHQFHGRHRAESKAPSRLPALEDKRAERCRSLNRQQRRLERRLAVDIAYHYKRVVHFDARIFSDLSVSASAARRRYRRHGTARHGTARHGTTQHGTATGRLRSNAPGYPARMNDTKAMVHSGLGNDSPETDSERHSLQAYVSDLLALIKHIEVPIDRQLQIDDSANYADALTIIRDVKRVTAAQRTRLEEELQRLGGDGAAGIKSAWSLILGAGAAAVGSVRKTKVSKNLRDDYTALGLASISYTMLHATALGLGNNSVATLAQRNLAEIAPIIVRISTAISAVVLQELRDDGETVAVDAAAVSAQITHEAWQHTN
jgi:ferritin-like metal-binding protein YciE